MEIKVSESGAILNLGASFDLSICISIDFVGELVESWSDVKSHVSQWRKKRADRAQLAIIWYTVPFEVVPATKALLGQHLVCSETALFADIKVHAFVVDPQGGYHCEIGIPNLD